MTTTRSDCDDDAIAATAPPRVRRGRELPSNETRGAFQRALKHHRRLRERYARGILTPPASEPLDPVELARVEGMHRGNLYQHLYGVASVFLMSRAGIVALQIDYDEDLELHWSDRSRYVQIKTRGAALTPSDVKTSLARFEALDAAHVNGTRKGTADYFIASNQRPGPALQELATNSAWQLLFPGGSVATPDGLAPPWSSVSEALDWCAAVANALPLRTLPARTLVWKLAAQIQAVAAGELVLGAGPHRLNDADVRTLLEQAAHQLHAFPQAPTPYRSFQRVPELNGPITLVVGLPGSGKTSWAAETAQHLGENTVYFDAAAVDDQAFAQALLREVVAQIRSAPRTVAEPEFRSAGSGYEGIRAVDMLLKRNGSHAVVFVDNAHRVSVDVLARVTSSASALRWVLLSQPNAQLAVTEAKLGIVAQSLAGWTLSSVAAELRMQGATSSPQDAQSVIALTGGLPMFVRGLALQTAREFGGRTTAACDATRERTTASDTAQDVITAATFAALSTTSQFTLAVLIDIAAFIGRRWLVDVLGYEENVVAAALRELGRSGAIQQTQEGEIKAHSSFAGVTTDWALVNFAQITQARERLIEILRAPGNLYSRTSMLALYLRLLTKTKQFETLADIVTSSPERVHDYGLSASLTSAMEKAAVDPGLGSESRFWALDTLAFWHISKEDWTGGADYIELMGAIIDEVHSWRAKFAFHQKKLLLAAERRDLGEVKRQFAAAAVLAKDDLVERIHRYNYASVAFRLGSHLEAEREAASLMNAYYKLVGISQRELFAKNLPEVGSLLETRGADFDEVKRLADALYLYFLARQQRRAPSTLEVLCAHKLYAVTGHMSSAVRAGQEAADQSLAITADPNMARGILENVLAIVDGYGLTDYLVPVRAHHALILAYCGQVERARSIMRELAPFLPDVPQQHRDDVVRQMALIEEIAQGKRRLRREASLEDSLRLIVSTEKFGRNDPCPCGSGLKYKKCHG